MQWGKWFGFLLVTLTLAHTSRTSAQLLDKQKLLEAQTFWDNRDWDWYQQQIPLFECPDADLTTIYYYRWELLTKHLTYGSPSSGYTFTEFIDRPFWSGAYGAISCPAGHQLYEARWLRSPRIARDFARYWFRTPGAQPRNYSTWLADAVWQTHRVWPQNDFVIDLLPDLIKNYQGWEKSHFVPAVGLFWQTGHDDGMEFNINSRQTRDILRGGPGYRTTLNSYLWADALAIARVARLKGDRQTAEQFAGKAARLKKNLQKQLWDPKREFFFQKFRDDEEREGHKVRALSLTYQTGKYADSPHGRELYNYVPWQFSLPDKGFESAWKFLMDPKFFAAEFGPTTVERHDPQFYLSKTCCWWSGMSWPYATTQTLVALANLLNDYEQNIVTRDDYLKLLRTYARTHRKAGKPYLAEACHPDTGSWEGHDGYNHSEHYFHSGFCDLIITGLVGLRPRDDDTLEVNPLAPATWDYFALEDVPYRHHRLTIFWDRTGQRYGRGSGLRLWANGKELASSARLERLTVKLPTLEQPPLQPSLVNYAINNDGRAYPRVTASINKPQAPIAKINDGNYWYHISPPNRWTCEGTRSAKDWCALDFGIPRRISQLHLYFLDDGKDVIPPEAFAIEKWDGQSWVPLSDQQRSPEKPTGRRVNRVMFATPVTLTKFRVVFTHAKGGVTGLTELEAWSDDRPPYVVAPPPPGNLAVNLEGKGFPKATASFTSPYDRVSMANDGAIFLTPTPHNRWTTYTSPNKTDWLEIDFGTPKEVGRVDLHLYDDRGGVQPPTAYTVEIWDGKNWREARQQKKEPPQPTGSTINRVTFAREQTARVRVVFTHRGQARTGLSEIEIRRD